MLRSHSAEHKFSYSSFNQKSSLKPKAQPTSFSTKQEQSHCTFTAQPKLLQPKHTIQKVLEITETALT